MAGVREEDLAWLLRQQPQVHTDTSHIRIPCEERYKKANILSKAVWCWLDPLIWKGWRKKQLEHSDIPKEPQNARSERLQKKFQKHWEEELARKRDGKKPRIWMAFLQMFWLRFLFCFLASALEVALQVAQSIFVGLLADFFISNMDAEATRNAYIYAACIAICTLFQGFVHAHLFFFTTELGMLGRVVLTGAIYKKIFQLSQETIGEVTTGKILNMISHDVQRLDVAFLFTSYIVLAPIHLVLTLLLLWFYLGLGPSSLTGIGLLVLLLPLQYWLGKLFSRFRFATAKLTDKRVRVMNEIISGIRVIKMYGWEYAFTKVITDIRKKETRLILLASFIRAVSIALFLISVGVINLVMFATYTLTTGLPLRPSIAFTALSLVVNLRISAVSYMSQVILSTAEVRVAFTRVQKLLLRDLPDPLKKRRYSRRPTITSLLSFSQEKDDPRISDFSTLESLSEKETPSIVVESLTAAWKTTEARDNGLALSNISFSCDMSSRLLAIVGPVGAGKSSILQCLVGELQPLNGTVEMVGSLGYSSQDPWVFSGSVRENVLFGQPFEEDWYQTVLRECCLQEDVAMMPLGDATLVGERGVALSGGQKSRVTLARAVYRKADVYVLDDPLSAVDTVVGRRLFQTCMSGVLRNSVVVLVTHHLQYAQLADNMLVIDQGESLAYGTYDDIMGKIDRADEHPTNARIKEVLSEMVASLRLQDDKAAMDLEVTEHSMNHSTEEEEENDSNDKTVLQFSVADPGEDDDTIPALINVCSGQGDDDTIPLINVCSGQGDDDTIPLINVCSGQGDDDTIPLTNVCSGQGDDDTIPLINVCSGQVSVPADDLPFKQPSLHEWAGKQGTSPNGHQATDADSKSQEVDGASGSAAKEDREEGSVKMMTYVKYFLAGGGYIGTLCLLILFLTMDASIVASDWWLSEWAEANSSCASPNSTNYLCDFSTNLILAVFSGLVGLSIVLSFVRTLAFFYVCVHAAQVLHNRMFASAIRAPVRFFDTNSIGRILNRFSKDLGFLDDLLPYQFYEYLTIFMRFMSIVVVAGVANYFIFILVAVVLVVFLVIRTYFLQSARQIKRLEAISRSPLFSHVSATLQGLTTIRACERQRASEDYFHAYQDEQTKAWVTFLHCARWFGLRIDTVSGLFIISVVVLAIPLASSPALDSALIGLSLAYTISLAGRFQHGVRLSTEVESLMISTERLLAYSKLTPEASLETPPGVEKPDRTWPQAGALSFRQLKFRYAKDLPYIIKAFDLEVQPGEKIGIVGRTGAGKSSLLQALFRMSEPEGIVEIDGVVITDLGLHDLRQRISIIPQDPVLFSGTIRYNLDPFSRYSDQQVWTVLEQVQLKEVVGELEGELQAEVTEGGSNFSVGQRQLICLGRALLKKNKILVVDEATANVDMTTDAIIQQTIRRELVDCTTLTIAHRLNTIMDADRILVMSGGRVHECDTPPRLLSRPDGLLSRMVDQTGPTEAARLRCIAADSRHSRGQPITGLLESYM